MTNATTPDPDDYIDIQILKPASDSILIDGISKSGSGLTDADEVLLIQELLSGIVLDPDVEG